MKKVPFVKYTACGNKFVIVDEISQTILTEPEKKNFASQATDLYFGIGCDNFLVIQPCKTNILQEINQEHHYWDTLPVFNPDERTFIFRMFEPDGKEAYSCGNGLLCIAHYLFQTYQLDTVRILTQVPAVVPRLISIGFTASGQTSWSNMGPPGPIPSNLINSSLLTPYNDCIMMIQDLSISFSKSELIGLKEDIHLELSGYAIFTGEPHLVILTETGISSSTIADKLLESYQVKQLNSFKTDYSSWIIHEIGMYFNRRYPQYFPEGLNINFIRVVDNRGIIEQRTFERGVNRETWACGTGAVASAYIAHRLKLIAGCETQVLPYLCRLRNPNFHLRVKPIGADYFLYGQPLRLFDGVYQFNEPLETDNTAFPPPLPEKTQFIYGSVVTVKRHPSITFHFPILIDI